MKRDIWTDEAFTVSYTAHPNLSLLLDDVRKNEETPPIAFVLSWAWAGVVGHSEVALRAFAVFWGVLAALLFAGFAQRWLPSKDAAIAATVLALAPLLASYLIEARGYTLTLFFAIACMAVFEQLYRQPERGRFYMLYAPLAAALFLTSYFGVALLLAHNLIWLALLFRSRAQWRRRFFSWCGVQVFICAVVLLWLPGLLYQMKVAPAVTSAWALGLLDYYILALSLLLNVPPHSAWLPLWIALALAGTGLMFIALLRARGQDEGLVVRTFWVPALVLTLLIIWMRVVAPRYLLILLPGGALAVAQGARELRRAWPRLGVMLIALFLVSMLVYRLPDTLNTEPRKPWSALVREVEQHADPTQDVVLFHPPWDQRVFEYYYHGPALPLLGVHDYDTFYYEDRSHDLRTTWTSAQALAATRGYRRVWVFYDQMFHTVPRLQLGYTELGHWKNDRLELFLYEAPKQE
jgi:4-amino-4-deoxy-L-arabinose transferase-like glycosyltransferase